MATADAVAFAPFEIMPIEIMPIEIRPIEIMPIEIMFVTAEGLVLHRDSPSRCTTVFFLVAAASANVVIRRCSTRFDPKPVWAATIRKSVCLTARKTALRLKKGFDRIQDGD